MLDIKKDRFKKSFVNLSFLKDLFSERRIDMKIGIVIHSYTGNTLLVAEKIRRELEQKGHCVEINRVEALDEDPSKTEDIKIKTSPEIYQYDMVIFGAPVRAFSVSPAMALYLGQLNSMQDKKALCFVTQALPFEWMGGKRAISQMKKALYLKYADIPDTGIINWSNSNREKKIKEMVERFGKI